MMLNTSLINWQKVDGLLPVIIQHAQTGQVLMLGYMNDEALAKTINEGKITFYSRTKQRLWTKGVHFFPTRRSSDPDRKSVV